MLVLERKLEESVIVGEGENAVEVMVLKIAGNRVHLGFEGHDRIRIHRKELREEMDAKRKAGGK